MHSPAATRLGVPDADGGLEPRFAAAMGALLGPDFPADLGLAVSGGGDSMAMLTLAHYWTRAWGVRLWVITIDHGLRAESAAEAALVRETCAELGHPHATARWTWDGTGNVMDAARRARLGLIDRWRGPIGAVLMAHTADDIAEGFAMRLARGAGVAGLAAMEEDHRVRPGPVAGGITGDSPDGARLGTDFRIIRPCLGMRRSELRHYLRTLKGRWVEDPTNADMRYDRARARAALDGLEIGAETLIDTALRLRSAERALRAQARAAWQAVGMVEAGPRGPTGDLLIDRDGLAGLERETQLRLISAALCWISVTDYPPRAAARAALLDRVLAGAGGTLHGVTVSVERAQVRFAREWAAAGGPVGVEALWDRRWQAVDAVPDTRIAALGQAGWAQIPAAHRIRPHATALALPALWAGKTVLSCDALDYGPGPALRLFAPLSGVITPSGMTPALNRQG